MRPAPVIQLRQVARDFYARPQATIPRACNGDVARVKATYRLMNNEGLSLKNLLEAPCRQTVTRMGEHKVVLAVQDTTSLNYTAHGKTVGLGPISTRTSSAVGLQCQLGLGSYQTAWAWLHKLRRAMVRPGRDRLSHDVEVDETYVGGPEEGVMGLLQIADMDRFEGILQRVADGLVRDHAPLKAQNRSLLQPDLRKHRRPDLPAKPDFPENQRGWGDRLVIQTRKNGGHNGQVRRRLFHLQAPDHIQIENI